MIDPDEREAIVFSAFQITMSVLVNLEEAERKHLLIWMHAMLKNKTRDGRPKTRGQRVEIAKKISRLYGRPRGLARKLRCLLWERGLANEELARKLGTTAKHVSRWLAGDSSPSQDNRWRVAQVLGLDDEELSDAGRDPISG